jgi:hypothetical protein
MANRLSSLHGDKIDLNTSAESVPAILRDQENMQAVLPLPASRSMHPRSYLKGHKNRPPPVLPPLVLARPSPQRGLPSFSSLVPSPDGLGGALDSCRPSELGQERGNLKKVTEYVASSLGSVIHSSHVSHGSGTETWDAIPSPGTVSSLDRTSHHGVASGNAQIGVAWTLLGARGVSAANIVLSEIDPGDPMLKPSSQPRVNGIASYAAQLFGKDGSIQSKAWDIHIYATTGSSYGPKLRIRIYHDTSSPYRFPPLSPTRKQWLCVKLACSKSMLREDGPELAETLHEDHPTFRRTIALWGLNQQDERVLKFALNSVGNGSKDGTSNTQPWRSFLKSCRDWHNSEQFDMSKERRRIRWKRSSRSAKTT